MNLCTNSNRVPRDPKLLSGIQVSRSIKNSIKAEVFSYDGRCVTCKSGSVTRMVKSLPKIIIISGDQLKSPENIPEYIIINEESDLFILVLVTLFISEMDHFISLFRFFSSTWLYDDGLASIKTKIVKNLLF